MELSSTLIYDYLTTKKKLEESNELKGFVSPVMDFKPEAYADANVKGLKKGDIIQFERKRYYVSDGTTGEGVGLRLEFIYIPDGKRASPASKHVSSQAPTQNEKPVEGGGKKDKQLQPKKTGARPTKTNLSMYKIDQVDDEDLGFESDDAKMYKVDNVYEGQVGSGVAGYVYVHCGIV